MQNPLVQANFPRLVVRGPKSPDPEGPDQGPIFRTPSQKECGQTVSEADKTSTESKVRDLRLCLTRARLLSGLLPICAMAFTAWEYDMRYAMDANGFMEVGVNSPEGMVRRLGNRIRLCLHAR